MTIPWANARIILTGGAGFLGQAIHERLLNRGVPADRVFIPRRAQYDLADQNAVARMYADAERALSGPPSAVIHLAAEVGGIGANRDNPGRYFYANMAMALHLIEQFRQRGYHEQPGSVFLQTGTICAYPKFAPIPFKEEDIWNGYPEETNAPYGVAKKAAWQMLDAYRLQYNMRSAYVLPVNLYGPRDNFNLHSSHVIPALIRKCVEAMDRGDDHIVCWGTGSASREFLYVDDAADGILRAAEVMEDPTPINLGAGFEITIKDLVHLIARLTGFATEETIDAKIKWDTTKPDGQPRRSLSTERAAKLLNWRAAVSFEEGLARTIAWFREHRHDADARL
ncbi:MAG: NAD-dependent epimerase/dehydratase family protein [Phycisphaerales bacterium]